MQRIQDIIMSFNDLGLSAPLLKAIASQGYETPSPIQEKAIPAVLDGRDVMAAAQTGTGKTAGFTLPILQRLSVGRRAQANQARALILTPTRELAAQVGESVREYGKHMSLTSTVVFGGVKINPQMMKLRRGVDVLVATPGRLMDLHSQNAVKFDHLEVLVLDEADRMLDMGFREDIQKVIDMLPKDRQTLMFSATMAPKIREFAKKILKDPKEVNVAIGKPAAGVLQAAYLVNDTHKTMLLDKLIKDKPAYKSIIIFSSTKKKVADIHRSLKRQGHNVESISSDLTQETREKVLSKPPTWWLGPGSNRRPNDFQSFARTN